MDSSCINPFQKNYINLISRIFSIRTSWYNIYCTNLSSHFVLVSQATLAKELHKQLIYNRPLHLSIALRLVSLVVLVANLQSKSLSLSIDKVQKQPRRRLFLVSFAIACFLDSPGGGTTSQYWYAVDCSQSASLSLASWTVLAEELHPNTDTP